MLSSLSASYCGPPPLPSDLWGRWNFDPWLIAALLLALGYGLYRAKTSRERFALSSGVALLAVVFISPLCALTVALFSARAVHHIALVAVIAPLLAITIGTRTIRDNLAKLLMPLVLLHTATFWLWHVPDAYSFALSNTAVYWLMQLSLLGTAVVVWTAIFAATPARAIAGLLFLAIQMGMLGAVLVFSGQPLYAPHFATTQAFGFDPLSDQQLAGLIMWVPASLPYLAVIILRLLDVFWRAEVAQT